MDIKKLVTFINLVEFKNYTKTAKAMHMTQPTVTHDINAIENEVGVKLFKRNKRSVMVTKNGWAFYQKIRPLINNYYSAVQDIQKNDLDEDNKITLGCSFTPFNDLYIPLWMKNFQQKYPQIKFSVYNLTRNELKQHLVADELDIMITTSREAVDLRNVKSYVLETEPFKAIVPKNNPLSKKKILKLTDFQNQKMLFLDGNWASVDLINLQNKIIAVNQQIKIAYAEDLPSLNILSKSEQGIAVGLYCIYAELNKNLTYVPIDWEPQVDLVVITTKTNRKKTVREFIKLIQKFDLNINQ